MTEASCPVRSRVRDRTRVPFVLIVLLLLAEGVTARGSGSEPPPALPGTETFRVGVSYASFGTLNRNDATAALKAWAATVSRERRLSVRVTVEMFEQEEDLKAGLTAHRLEAASMTTQEFLSSGLNPEGVFLTSRNGDFTERYVLVVPQSAGIRDVTGLKGKRLLRHLSPKLEPAWPWLHTLLAARGLGRPGDCFSSISTVESPSKAVLRVFFHQTDVCLVTTNAFDLACELNPQLRRDLQVLAVSPPMVPSLMFLRPDYRGSAQAELESALVELHLTTAGLQVLTMFLGNRLEKLPLSSLDSTREVFAAFARLRASTEPEPSAATRTVPLTP